MLKQPPTTAHLSRLYYELAGLGARAIGAKNQWPYEWREPEELLGLACEMSRYDPRLLSLLVEYFLLHWKKLNPHTLRNFSKDMATPQTLAVMLNFIAHCGEEEFLFYEYVTKNLLPAKVQLYFYNLYLPGSKQMQRAALEPLQEFEDWGFLARERPIVHDEATGKRILLGRWGPRARQQIIRKLSGHLKQFSLYEYLKAVDHMISRQQALQDLKASPYVKSQGKGRGSVWMGLGGKY